MAALDTAEKMVTRARVLLQDAISPYRYTDDELVQGLNLAILEARRIRPDLFLSVSSLPEFTAANSDTIAVDDQYRVALLYYVVGHAQLRDEEDTSDTRAAAFLNKFVAQLTTIQA